MTYNDCFTWYFQNLLQRPLAPSCCVHNSWTSSTSRQRRNPRWSWGRSQMGGRLICRGRNQVVQPSIKYNHPPIWFIIIISSLWPLMIYCHWWSTNHYKQVGGSNPQGNQRLGFLELRQLTYQNKTIPQRQLLSTNQRLISNIILCTRLPNCWLFRFAYLLILVLLHMIMNLPSSFLNMIFLLLPLLLLVYIHHVLTIPPLRITSICRPLTKTIHFMLTMPLLTVTSHGGYWSLKPLGCTSAWVLILLQTGPSK